MSEESVAGETAKENAAAEREALAEETPVPQRQWVSIPGGSCDVRMGAGALEHLGTILKVVVGKPRMALVVSSQECEADLLERVRRELVSAGFSTSIAAIPAGGEALGLKAHAALCADFANACITSDDVVVALGGSDVLSASNAVAADWCGGVPLACIPTDLRALTEAALTPAGLSVGDRANMIQPRGCCRQIVCDTRIVDFSLAREETSYALALMVATACAESEQAFERLWNNSQQIMAGDEDVIAEQALDTLKCRGRIASSTALAVRQSVAYGQVFQRAMSALLPSVPASTLLAEALRFSARLSAGMGKASIDDVLMQDELLERLGLPMIEECALGAQDMCGALRDECFLRSNRFMLPLPQKIGRVRLSTIEDDLLCEHTGAWCASRGADPR